MVVNNSTSRRTVLLRGVLVLSLLTAIGVCVSLSYLKLKETEEQVGLQNYLSIRDSTLLGARAICERKLQGVDLWATLMANIMPNAAEDWPNVVFDGYLPVSAKLAALTQSTTYALMALLSPDQAPAFEAHIAEQYQAQGRPPEAGYSDFGFGIWKRSSNTTNEDGRVHDTTGVTNWDAPKSGELIVALSNHNQPAANSLLLNLYSIENRGVHIDSMFDCVNAHNHSSSVVPQCTVTTDILQLVIRPGPAGLVFHPIFPANDPTQFVGFATTSLHWEEVLTSVVPDYVTGLRCIISTETQAWTFEIQQGLPVLIGEGDLHGDQYESYSESIILNEYETGAATSATYTLTIYPTEELLNTFRTDAPRSVALGFLGAITACALLFFLYDWLMRYENHERLLILEMKRRFVRFISHEIRTPLNTVCMGLELLQGELRTMSKGKKVKIPPETITTGSRTHSNGSDVASKNPKTKDTIKTVSEDIELWQTVVDDIHENAYVAVSILNDLLNYDKLETGTMKLELHPVFIWELIQRTHSQFRIQATNANLDLQLELHDSAPDHEKDVEAPKYSRWCIIGDDIRIAQVLRNIISNALKFTPPDGVVKIMAEYVPNGLPNAKSVHVDEGDASKVDGEDHPERAGSIRIAIKDSGVGMTPAQIRILFNEGVQFDANRLQHGGGSGLGLSIAKGIVEQHQGSIVVKSDGPGHGTTFLVEFPLYKLSEESFVKTMQAGHGGVDRSSNHETESESSSEEQPRRVLVAEDALSSRKMLIRLLERAGHKTVPAANGQVAVEEIRKDLDLLKEDPEHIPIDTVLTDYEMPVLKGPDAAKQMRELGYAGIILGVTGNVLEEDVVFFKEHGANDVLAKPVRMECINAYWQALRTDNVSSFTRSRRSDQDLFTLEKHARQRTSDPSIISTLSKSRRSDPDLVATGQQEDQSQVGLLISDQSMSSVDEKIEKMVQAAALS